MYQSNDFRVIIKLDPFECYVAFSDVKKYPDEGINLPVGEPTLLNYLPEDASELTDDDMWVDTQYILTSMSSGNYIEKSGESYRYVKEGIYVIAEPNKVRSINNYDIRTSYENEGDWEIIYHPSTPKEFELCATLQSIDVNSMDQYAKIAASNTLYNGVDYEIILPRLDSLGDKNSLTPSRIYWLTENPNILVASLGNGKVVYMSKTLAPLFLEDETGCEGNHCTSYPILSDRSGYLPEELKEKLIKL